MHIHWNMGSLIWSSPRAAFSFVKQIIKMYVSPQNLERMGMIMAKKGINIYKRKDNRWEARYVKGRTPAGKIQYGYVYGKSYHEARDKQLQAQLAGSPRAGKGGNGLPTTVRTGCCSTATVLKNRAIPNITTPCTTTSSRCWAIIPRRI